MDDNIKLIQGRKRRKKKEPKETPVRDWMKKPMHDTTIGDTLLLHVFYVGISVAIPLAIQGWVIILSHKKQAL